MPSSKRDEETGFTDAAARSAYLSEAAEGVRRATPRSGMSGSKAESHHENKEREDPSMLERAIDVATAAAGLVLASPLMLLIAWLIRLDDGGPALFTQVRVGAGKKPFRIYKFRTMRDGLTTRVGRWLRATGLDELPQLGNMLRGEMSLIGPRPLTRDDVSRLGWDDDAHAERWSVRPGVVGLAQLYAGRGKRLSWFLDVTYVRERRIALDLGILAATALIGVLGKRRVRAWLRAQRRRVSVERSVRPIRRPVLADVSAGWAATPR